MFAPFVVVRYYVQPERYRQIISAMIGVSRHCKRQANTRLAPTLCVGRLRLNGDYLHPIPNLGGYLQYILECLLTLFYFEEYDHKNFSAIDAFQKCSSALVFAPFVVVRSYVQPERYRQIISAMIVLSRHAKNRRT